MVFYRTIPVPIEHKCCHVHKIGGKLHCDFTKDFGDIPIGRFNEITNQFEEVVNTRGNAYAARKRKKFRHLKKP